MKEVNNDVTKYLLETEKKSLETIKNPFVVKCEKVIQNAEFCYIVMEECTGGTLKEYIKKQCNRSDLMKLFYLKKMHLTFLER